MDVVGTRCPTLTLTRPRRMVSHMKTTLVIDDTVMERLRKRAAADGTTISKLVEAALRRMLEAREGAPPRLPPLPAFDGGGALVDVADRDALYQAMEGR